MSKRKGIISNFKQFRDAYKKVLASFPDTERENALNHYFSSGGIISVGASSGGWPKLIYPSPLRIQAQINELTDLRKLFLDKQGDWKQKRIQAQTYMLVNRVKKLKDPLYWQHMAKLLRDPDYRDDAKRVSLPVDLVADKKWRPMIKMFVKNIEYRKQLTETVETSIVYKKDKELAKYASQLQEFRKEMSEGKINSLQKKIDALNQDLHVLQEIMKWAKES